MSLLMPDYEKQLRAAARRLAGDTPADATADANKSRGGPGSWVLLGLAGALTVAIAVTALVLLGHRGVPSRTPAATAQRPTQHSCSAHQILRASGRLRPIARGTIAGESWTLEADGARRGLRSVQAGRLLLDGRAYGFCRAGIDVELVNAGAHGIVYGLAAERYRPPILIQASTARVTAANAASAPEFPARTRRVPGGTLFLRALPASACAYRGGLGLTASAGSTTSQAGVSSSQILVLVGHFTRSCRPGQLLQSSPQESPPAGGASAGHPAALQVGLSRPLAALIPAVSQTPAAGICPKAGGGSTVTVYVGNSTPEPRCLKVRPSQRLEVINAESPSGPPDRTVTIAWPPFPRRKLEPGQSILFGASFGTYLATGDHEVGLSRYRGAGPEIWLRP